MKGVKLTITKFVNQNFKTEYINFVAGIKVKFSWKHEYEKPTIVSNTWFILVKCKYLVKYSQPRNFLYLKLTLPILCISKSCIKIKIKLNFYFHTSLWCHNRFYEGQGLHKTFWGTTKKCENENLTYIFLFVWDWDGKG